MPIFLLTIWQFVRRINLRGWLWMAGISLFIALVVSVAFLTHEQRIALKEKKDAQIEANRQKNEADGLKILVNTQPQAANIELERIESNKMAENSNTSFNSVLKIRNGNFTNTSLSDAERARCRAYPSQRCK